MAVTLGGISAAVCSTCLAGTYAEFGWSTCSSCDLGTYATKTGATSSATCEIVLQIFQFKAPYLLTDVTENIKSRMSLAVANVLGIISSNVVLSFTTSVFDRRQQAGVLVSAGITDSQVSAASYASRLTQDKLNTEMVALGLKSIQLVQITGMSHELRILSIGSHIC